MVFVWIAFWIYCNHDYIMYFSKPLKRSKYGNKTSFFRGQGYDSKAEVSQAMELDSMLRKGEIKGWTKQKSVDLVVNGYLICTYKVDFVIEHLDGITEYLEVKGFATSTWRIKWKLFEALYGDDPNIKLTVAWLGKSVNFKKKKV